MQGGHGAEVIQRSNQFVENSSPHCHEQAHRLQGSRIDCAREFAMTRYKTIDTSPRFFAANLEAQLLPGTFEHALHRSARSGHRPVRV
jgi:hypothetical protein